MSFVMQWMAVLGIFRVHKQQLISTSGMPVQLLRVIKNSSIQGHFSLGKLENIKLAFKGHASPSSTVHCICMD
jgi:hypothetical protein